MRFLIILIVYLWWQEALSMDYYIDHSVLLDQNDPVIKSLIYFAVQNNKIYICVDNINVADKANELLLIFLRSNIEYELNCAVSISGVMVRFKS